MFTGAVMTNWVSPNEFFTDRELDVVTNDSDLYYTLPHESILRVTNTADAVDRRGVFTPLRLPAKPCGLFSEVVTPRVCGNHDTTVM